MNYGLHQNGFIIKLKCTRMIGDKVRTFVSTAKNQSLRKALLRTYNYFIFRTNINKLRDKIYKIYLENKYGDGLDVMGQDWDNLIILDACRYDVFASEFEISGDLTKVMSGGSYSWEFMQHNFVGKDLNDTVYVTSNPYHYRLDDEFHKVISALEYWDEETGTVLPEDVTDLGLQAAEEFPNKRIIVHYMQPHTPYLGDTINELQQDQVGFDKYFGVDDMYERNTGKMVWDFYREGALNKEELMKSYIETLKIAEKEIERLITGLDGKTIITADHGENHGEFVLGMEILGHGKQTKQCRFVPWLELESENRREIIADESSDETNITDSAVAKERLKQLGYLPEEDNSYGTNSLRSCGAGCRWVASCIPRERLY